MRGGDLGHGAGMERSDEQRVGGRDRGQWCVVCLVQGRYTHNVMMRSVRSVSTSRQAGGVEIARLRVASRDPESRHPHPENPSCHQRSQFTCQHSSATLSLLFLPPPHLPILPHAARKERDTAALGAALRRERQRQRKRHPRAAVVPDADGAKGDQARTAEPSPARHGRGVAALLRTQGR